MMVTIINRGLRISWERGDNRQETREKRQETREKRIQKTIDKRKYVRPKIRIFYE